MKATFKLSKETKGAVQYKEVDSAGKELDQHDALIGTLYLRKAKLPSPFPETIDVDVTIN